MNVRKAIIYALAAAACFFAACISPQMQVHAAGREELAKDPSPAGRQFNMIRIYVDTRRCMVDSASALIRHKVYQQEELVLFAMALCSAPLRSELIMHGGYTIDETEPLLRHLALESAREAIANPQ